MIILTGHKGFIGKKFDTALTKLGKKVYGVEQNDCSYFRNYFNNWNDVEMIIHQGAISSTTETNLDKIYEYNIDFSQWLFTMAAKYNIPVKYASSASVYGNQTGIINPLNYYALSKVTIDYWVEDHMEEFPLIQGFRYFNVYGDGENHKADQASPVSKFTKQIKETGKLKLFEGSENYLRDFICVDDIVDLVLGNGKKSGIYDLGTSAPVSFQFVAECCIKKYGGDIEYIPFPNHLKGKYQDYTCAKKLWGDYKFKTIPQYLGC